MAKQNLQLNSLNPAKSYQHQDFLASLKFNQRFNIIVLVLLFLGCCLLLSVCLISLRTLPFDQLNYSVTATPESTFVLQNDLTQDQVVKVVDGDTLKLAKLGTVRLIGIDTPELKDPRKPIQCFAQAASDQMKLLTDQKTVYWRSDPTQDQVDKYGRRLVYLYLADGVFVNLKMVADGYAYEYTYQKPYQEQANFRQTESEAKKAKFGLWATDACNGLR